MHIVTSDRRKKLNSTFSVVDQSTSGLLATCKAGGRLGSGVAQIQFRPNSVGAGYKWGEGWGRRVGEGGVETNNKFYRSSTACLAFHLQEMQIVQFSLSLDPIYKIADLFTTGSSSQHFQMRPSG